MKPFDNEERKRFYGLRKGDVVSPKNINGTEWSKGPCEVIEYGFMDNNAVYLKSSDGTRF
jgi:hypothetical protein